MISECAVPQTESLQRKCFTRGKEELIDRTNVETKPGRQVAEKLLSGWKREIGAARVRVRYTSSVFLIFCFFFGIHLHVAI